jgi:hypothetical protein
MVTSCSSIANSRSMGLATKSSTDGWWHRMLESYGTTSGSAIARHPSFSRVSKRVIAVLLVGFTPVSALADIASDEDELLHEFTFAREFKRFHIKHGRYPRTWIELGARMGCTGYDTRDPRYLPKPNEAIVWRPDNCQLAYKIEFADKRRFRIVALANGHVVSINDTFRVTYLKTPYHSHEPPECPSQSAC